MPAPTPALPADASAAAPDVGFTRALVTLMRAHDPYGVWARTPDDALLATFVRTPEQRRSTEVLGSPDDRAVWRVEVFFNAVGLAATRHTGVDVISLSKVSNEGFGRVVLTAGRLVVLDRPLRDVHRFGFESVAALQSAGERMVTDIAGLIERFADVARTTS